MIEKLFNILSDDEKGEIKKIADSWYKKNIKSKMSDLNCQYLEKTFIYQLSFVLKEHVSVTKETLSKLNPENCFKILKKFYNKEPETKHTEFVSVLYLHDKRIIGFEFLSKGGFDSAIVDTKKIIANALVCRANSIILAHNHPSGNLQPSSADISIGKKVKECCKIFDIKVLDSIILTESEEMYYSTAEEEIQKVNH
jgi:DNA repair protein RadC